jgi:dienelactone hydrolase
MNQYPDHSKLLEYRDGKGVHPVKTPEDWAKRRADILLGMQEVMGPLPTDRPPLDTKIDETLEQEGYVRYRLSYQADKGDRVPAYLLVPSVLQGKAPAILCLHQTTAIGKGEPVGLGPRTTLHYAKELAERGYICLAPDYPSFGDYAYDFNADRYTSGSMKAIWNNIRGVDLLTEWPEVDPAKFGCIGHSLGGHNTIFTSVFDTRIQAAVSCCGFTAFGKYYGGDLKGWSSDRYMPKIPSYGGWQKMPFDFHELIAALAPRAFMAVAPLHDANFDNGGVREVMAAAREV